MGRRSTAVGAALAALVVLVSGCARDTGGEPVPEPQPVVGADLSGTGPGTLVSAQTMPAIDDGIRALGARAVKVVYRSTSAVDGSDTEVSGAVFTPAGAPPAGGWPVIAFAHGTTGILESCAPTSTPDLAGGTALIASYLKLGFAVAATDYQGLGTPGVHPYLDARTAGRNVIDSVRALRKTVGGVSTRWAAFGGSQGGGATWSANEQAGEYAPELSLVGTVSLVPAADVSGLVNKAEAGTLTDDQNAAYIWLLNRVAATFPDLDLDQYRSESLAASWDALAVCAGPLAADRARALNAVEPNDLRPTSPDAADRLRGILESWAVEGTRAAAPMTVYYGGEDTYIDPEWTRAALEQSCDSGSTVAISFQPDKGHADVDGNASVTWLGERFAGMDAPDDC
ncbi:Secretory lipase [Rhodococcoides kroppenstedtii]|uniref:Secretory lipase n=1 Tax=Rhodococcoides kroppenstedtii TaxID=293050 RepID=A0A1I0TMR2_9NOCA|nr:Secretory lipase [Rhodococcus kroppenstedtii]